MSEGRKRLLSYLVFLAVAIAVLVTVHTQIAAGASDFSAFYSAGEIVRTGHGSSLYDYDTQRLAQQQFSYRKLPLPYIHLPFETAIYAPLSLLRYPHAFLFWWICNQLLLLATLRLMASAFPGIRPRLHFWILALAFFTPLQIALMQGQDSVLTLFLLAACLVLLTRHRHASAGAVLAIALYKPQLILPIFLVLAVGLSWRFLCGFLASALSLAALSAALISWRALLALPRFLAWFNTLPVAISGADPLRMANLRGVLLQSGLHPSVLTVALLSFALLLLAIFASSTVTRKSTLDSSPNTAPPLNLRTTAPVVDATSALPTAALSLDGSRNDAPLALRFTLAVSVAALISYHVMSHDLTILILPFLLAIHELSSHPIIATRTTIAALATAALMFIPSIDLDPRVTFLAIALFAASFWTEMHHRSRLVPVSCEH